MYFCVYLVNAILLSRSGPNARVSGTPSEIDPELVWHFCRCHQRNSFLRLARQWKAARHPPHLPKVMGRQFHLFTSFLLDQKLHGRQSFCGLGCGSLQIRNVR